MAGPLDLQETMRSSVSAIDDLLKRAQEGTLKAVTETPAGQPAMGGKGKALAELTTAAGVPGSLPQLAGALTPLPFGGKGIGGPVMRTITRGGPVTGPLKRIGVSGLTGAVTGAATGRDPLETGLQTAGGQVVGEALMGVPRLIAQGRKAGQLGRAREGAMATRQSKIDFDKAFTEALSWADKQAAKGANTAAIEKYKSDVRAAKTRHEQAIAAHGGATERYKAGVGADIATAWKQKVPAWKDIPATTEGLADMAYGKGRRLASEAFDTTMKKVVAEGRGRLINLSQADAKALSLDTKQWVERTPGVIEGVFDAGDVAAKATGKGATAPDTYRRVVSELDRLGIGDPKARGEYKAAMGIRQFIDKSGAFKGREFFPEKLMEGLTRLRSGGELERRGLGTLTEGPISTAMARPAPGPAPVAPPLPEKPGLLPAPAPRQVPKAPPEPPTLEQQGVRQRTPKAWPAAHILGGLGAGAGGGLAHAAGVPPYYGAGPGAAMGYGLGYMAGGHPITTRAPLASGIERGLNVAPSLINALTQWAIGGQ